MSLRSILAFACLAAVSPVTIPRLIAQGAPRLDSDSAIAWYARWAWEAEGRARVGSLAGMRWESVRGWVVLARWEDSSDASANAYFIEPPLRGVLALAEATADRALLDEVARFYVALLGRFRSVGDVSQRGSTSQPSAYAPQGEPGSRILPWLDRARGTPAAECPLCAAQALHPAGRLVLLISMLRPVERTPAMSQFLAAYVPLLVREHLVRLAFDVEWRVSVPRGADRRLVPRWEAYLEGHYGEPPRSLYRMRDTYLWMLATAADLLMAHAQDPVAVPFGTDSVALIRLVRAGTAMLARSLDPHPETRNRAGQRVGSLGYFEGDFADYEDYAFAANSDSGLPHGPPPPPRQSVSWDLSHIQRLPVVLRSLAGAKPATGLTFPDSTVLRLTANQYLYRSFTGSWDRPRFSNYFDGSDGWFRVGYGNRPDYGYPPSSFCDNRNGRRPCLTRGAVSGWQLLRFAQPELSQLGQALFRLASDSSAAAGLHRRRHFGTAVDRFAIDPSWETSPSLLLAQLAGEYLLGIRDP